jgi:hypothetical protein
MYSRNVIDVDWGLVVKLALPAKVTIGTPRSYLEFMTDLTNVLLQAKKWEILSLS